MQAFTLMAKPSQARFSPSLSLAPRNSSSSLPRTFQNVLFLNPQSKRFRFVPICSLDSHKASISKIPSNSDDLSETQIQFSQEESSSGWKEQVGSPNLPSFLPSTKLSLSDQAFFLLAFIACTTSVAFASLVVAAVPTLHAMGRAANSLAKLADTAREEIPSTMTAVRLSGMEISDLTLELSDLSKEIADGVNKSAQAVQAAEAGIQQVGTFARQKATAMIEERANLPVISVQPVVVGAAKKTSRAVGQATKRIMNLISGREDDDDDAGIDRLQM